MDKRRTINWNSQLRIEIKESGEEEPLGFIIDIFDRENDSLLRTMPIWYEDL